MVFLDFPKCVLRFPGLSYMFPMVFLYFPMAIMVFPSFCTEFFGFFSAPSHWIRSAAQGSPATRAAWSRSAAHGRAPSEGRPPGRWDQSGEHLAELINKRKISIYWMVYFMENPNQKWWFRCTPISGNLRIGITILIIELSLTTMWGPQDS